MACLASSWVSLARVRCGVRPSGRKGFWDSIVGCRDHPPQQTHHPGYQSGHLLKPCQVNLSASAIDELENTLPCFMQVPCCCLVIKTPSSPGILLAMQSPGSRGVFLLGETLSSRLWWQESGCG